ncbi:putative sugar O-methyltransferase [Azospirillum sp.]|uniref:putative sugar O-methyltransferase n=1 Tax=Azospirillum sp. TaxID=34012 RepID=UPI002D65ED30|nr:putative sugar O-methyltransferase [Azospirillum sp.]HYD71240.1 putative sugar O-methyltransferase [Azospirillum sp.]
MTTTLTTPSADLPAPWSVMLDNYLLARTLTRANDKSAHWDVFPENYEDVIRHQAPWETFLRNGISVGFNDDLLYVNDRWQYRLNHDFRDLIPETVPTGPARENIRAMIRFVMRICGTDFVKQVAAPAIGSPQHLAFTWQETPSSPQHPMRLARHDLSLIYYAWQISRLASPFMPSSAVFAEIGAGYGETMAKVKTIFPDARCILFDLAEMNAVQTYYLSRRFPDARILYLRDLEERGSAVFSESYDFLILPGWSIERVPDGYLNFTYTTRALQEMRNSVIKFYFEQIQRAQAIGGVYYCVSRYLKTSNDEAVEFSKFPYDDCWRMLLSHPCSFQSNCHELAVCRTNQREPFTVAEAMAGIDGRVLDARRGGQAKALGALTLRGKRS